MIFLSIDMYSPRQRMHEKAVRGLVELLGQFGRHSQDGLPDLHLVLSGMKCNRPEKAPLM
jgi:hypothetical protein